MRASASLRTSWAVEAVLLISVRSRVRGNSSRPRSASSDACPDTHTSRSVAATSTARASTRRPATTASAANVPPACSSPSRGVPSAAASLAHIASPGACAVASPATPPRPRAHAAASASAATTRPRACITPAKAADISSAHVGVTAHGAGDASGTIGGGASASAGGLHSGGDCKGAPCACGGPIGAGSRCARSVCGVDGCWGGCASGSTGASGPSSRGVPCRCAAPRSQWRRGGGQGRRARGRRLGRLRGGIRRASGGVRAREALASLCLGVDCASSLGLGSPFLVGLASLSLANLAVGWVCCRAGWAAHRAPDGAPSGATDVSVGAGGADGAAHKGRGGAGHTPPTGVALMPVRHLRTLERSIRLLPVGAASAAPAAGLSSAAETAAPAAAAISAAAHSHECRGDATRVDTRPPEIARSSPAWVRPSEIAPSKPGWGEAAGLLPGGQAASACAPDPAEKRVWSPTKQPTGSEWRENSWRDGEGEEREEGRASE
eukprot:scaffold31084_cov90-Isochrysis_galbana.AAC.2